jgi:hypothetical protein
LLCGALTPDVLRLRHRERGETGLPCLSPGLPRLRHRERRGVQGVPRSTQPRRFRRHCLDCTSLCLPVSLSPRRFRRHCLHRTTRAHTHVHTHLHSTTVLLSQHDTHHTRARVHTHTHTHIPSQHDVLAFTARHARPPAADADPRRRSKAALQGGAAALGRARGRRHARGAGPAKRRGSCRPTPVPGRHFQ